MIKSKIKILVYLKRCEEAILEKKSWKVKENAACWNNKLEHYFDTSHSITCQKHS